ncbi:hypothetical protein CDAR_44681 [Caerostris darwini]|uniref:Uncharacterized protein n=1 Tax=Caerostris darwini TaxID=1538125 RepID=A0AAV4QM86_9ARAC|nr:hypothetical protein CDAR_44681 [Caerostris darwini]
MTECTHLTACAAYPAIGYLCHWIAIGFWESDPCAFLPGWRSTGSAVGSISRGRRQRQGLAPTGRNGRYAERPLRTAASPGLCQRLWCRGAHSKITQHAYVLHGGCAIDNYAT